MPPKFPRIPQEGVWCRGASRYDEGGGDSFEDDYWFIGSSVLRLFVVSWSSVSGFCCLLVFGFLVVKFRSFNIHSMLSEDRHPISRNINFVFSGRY